MGKYYISTPKKSDGRIYLCKAVKGKCAECFEEGTVLRDIYLYRYKIVKLDDKSQWHKKCIEDQYPFKLMKETTLETAIDKFRLMCVAEML